MNISENTIATLVYTLQSAETGEILETIPENKPADFSFKSNQLLPGFEKNLTGLQANDHFDFTIMAQDAYGPKDSYAIFDIPIDTFEVDGKVNEKMLQVGNTIPMTDNEGNKHLGRIITLMKEAVTIDFNHPLAGVDLSLTGTVINVKENS